MKKHIGITFLLIVCLCLMAGCKAEQKNDNGLDTDYTPVQEGRSMTYDAETDRTTLINGEISLQLPGQWEEKDDCYINAAYGFINLIRYSSIVTVYDYSNEYTSTANWTIAGQESQLTITPLSDKITYGFHLNSKTATYQFIYTSNSDTEASTSTSLVATALQTCQLQQTSDSDTAQ